MHFIWCIFTCAEGYVLVNRSYINEKNTWLSHYRNSTARQLHVHAKGTLRFSCREVQISLCTLEVSFLETKKLWDSRNHPDVDQSAEALQSMWPIDHVTEQAGVSHVVLTCIAHFHSGNSQSNIDAVFRVHTRWREQPCCDAWRSSEETFTLNAEKTNTPLDTFYWLCQFTNLEKVCDLNSDSLV